MNTRAKRANAGSLLAIVVTLLVAASPGAADEYLVPPDNSAAVQYTEAYPTAGGNKNAEDGGPIRHPAPSEALGAANASRLQAKGADGAAAAELAAATAPTTTDVGGARHPRRQATATRRHGQPWAASVDGAVGAQGSAGLGTAVGQAVGLAGSDNPIILIVFLAAICWLAVGVTRRRKRQAP